MIGAAKYTLRIFFCVQNDLDEYFEVQIIINTFKYIHINMFVLIPDVKQITLRVAPGTVNVKIVLFTLRVNIEHIAFYCKISYTQSSRGQGTFCYFYIFVCFCSVFYNYS